MKLTGFTAIEYAEQVGITLNKYADWIDDGRSGVSVAEAEAIAVDDPALIWLEVNEAEYYSDSVGETATAEKAV